MTLKDCPCCKKPQTTKTAVKIGRQSLGQVTLLFFNCKYCNSTFTIRAAPLACRKAA